MISLQESLLVEADDLLMDYSCMTPLTESLMVSYGVSENDIEDTEKMTVAINKMKVKRDLKAILRVIEVAIVAVVAYRVAMGVINVLVVLAVSAIIYILYRLHKNVVKPAVSGVKNFFNKYITVVKFKKAQETDKKKKQTLNELNNTLEKSLARIESIEKEFGSKSDDNTTEE